MGNTFPRRYPKPHADDRYYTTSDLYLAAYLYAHGFWLINVHSDSPGKAQFVFRNGAEREVFVHEFRHGPEALVDARVFVFVVEDLKRRVDEAHPGR